MSTGNGNVKSKMSDLNDHLFEQLERLNDDDLKGDELGDEIDRSKAITSVAREIINNGRLVLDAAVKAEDSIRKQNIPQMLK